jgi:hypothetical protein
MLGLFDAHLANGRHVALRTRTLPALTGAAVAGLVQAGDTTTSPWSGIAVHHFHGAAARIPTAATAFGLRSDHLVAEIVAMWAPDDVAPARHSAWADAVADDLAGEALPGGYANLLGPQHQDQIDEAYGPNAARLLSIKARVDPRGVFSAIPLPRS